MVNVLFSCKTPKRRYHFCLMLVNMCVCAHAQMHTFTCMNVDLPFYISTLVHLCIWFIYESLLRTNTLELYERVKF